MQYFLAIDSGGTKCDALLLDRDGVVHGCARHQESGVSGRSDKAIVVAAQEALGDKVPENLSLVTYAEKYHPLFQQLGYRLFPQHEVEKMPDSLRILVTKETCAELAICGLQHGVVMLAGTGAFVYAVNRAGQERHYDALGPMLGDDGGGHYLGLRALRAAVRSTWHPRHATVLRERVFRHLGITSVCDAVEFSLSPRDRVVLASLSKVVNDAAEEGDAVATAILRKAAGAICETLYDALHALDMADDQYQLVGLGGIITGSRIYWQEVIERTARIAPRIECRIERLPLVIGVAVSGMRDVLGLDENATRALADRVGQSYLEYIKQGQK